MSILRYERPTASPASSCGLDNLLGSFVSILGSLPVLWLVWAGLVVCCSINWPDSELAGKLAWGLLLLPAAALLLMLRLVTVPVASRLDGRSGVGWALTLLLLSLAAEVGFGMWAGLVWQLL